MKILLSGADGMIGSHLLKYLLENTNHEIVCVCSWSHKGEPEKVLTAIKVLEELLKEILATTHTQSSQEIYVKNTIGILKHRK